ncbi:AAA family ATPase [Gallaecimonas pentaromativorans]|uniref:trifunctional serine/threonine-protein kinase/ATP-binding protein/sensor histidine kinase n=1 Tax=Gallaecimonas pentaromativorans TaxID=584787 RepID=UPI003A933D69
MAISQLLGRDSELAQIEQAYNRVARTSYCEIVLISGTAGVGKTALAKAFLNRHPSYSAAIAKADQSQFKVPYSSLAKALRSVTGPQAHATQQELFNKGFNEFTVLPYDEHFGRELVPTATLSSAQAQSNLHQRFLGCFEQLSSPGHPLVVVLDDLQWLDQGSLTLLPAFALGSQQDILLIGTYRTELDAGALSQVLNKVHQGALKVTHLQLAGLTQSAVQTWLAHSLPGHNQPQLSARIFQETGGNPFYVGLLLERMKSLGEEGQHPRPSSDDLKRLLRDKINQLPQQTRELLKLAAGIGATIEGPLLSKCANLPEQQLGPALNAALAQSLLYRDACNWNFCHDTVQDAAYRLLSATERQALHRRIAIAMLDLNYNKSRDNLLLLAGQLAKSAQLPVSPIDAGRFIRVLKTAATLARKIGVLDSARLYLDAGMAFSKSASYNPTQLWEIEALRCEGLLEDAGTDSTALAIESLINNSASPQQLAQAIAFKASMMTLRGRYEEATEITLDGLKQLHIDLPRQPSPQLLDQTYQSVMAKINALGPDGLLALPLLKDPATETAMGLLATLQSSFFANDGLMFLHLAKMVELTLKHGLTDTSCYALAWFGVSIASRHDAVRDGLSLAQTAKQLIDKHHFHSSKTAVLIALDQVSAWTLPLSYALEQAREAFAFGKTSGDLPMACYACNHVAGNMMVAGEHLQLVQDEIGRGLLIARQVGFRDVEDILNTQRAYACTMAQDGFKPGHITKAAGQSTLSPLLFWRQLFEGMAAFLFRDLGAAMEALAEAKEWRWATPAHIQLADWYLFNALCHIQSRHPQAAGHALECRAVLASYAQRNPFTFNNKVLLLDAELALMSGDSIAALAAYEGSARAAQAANLIHENALAYELAARCASACHLQEVAGNYLQKALAAYRDWGAHAKVKQLSAEFGAELAPKTELALKPLRDISHSAGRQLLIEKVLEDALALSSAQTALFICVQQQQLQLTASASLAGNKVQLYQDATPLTNQHAPLSIVALAVQTGKTLVFDNAIAEATEQHASSLEQHPVHSLLCLPLKAQGSTVAVLYLENNSRTHAFALSEVEALKQFADYAAIALHQSHLYAELLGRSTRQLQTESALASARHELIHTSHLRVLGGFAASLAHEINQPLLAMVANAAAASRWLKLTPPNMEEVATNLQAIESAGLRAGDIVRAVRTLARQAPEQLSLLEFDQVVEAVLGVLSTELTDSAADIETQLNANEWVLADSTQLQQVVLNLVTNALDAMTETEPGNRHLRITSSRRDNFVVLTIEDNGSGITAADRDQIFNPFFTTKDSGLGMGLAICRSIAQVHGGTLDIASTSPNGTVMVLTLPVAQPQASTGGL